MHNAAILCVRCDVAMWELKVPARWRLARLESLFGSSDPPVNTILCCYLLRFLNL